ncbi:SDR family oxidoreductase [Marinoscillum furvescens]|uniref:NAD(P)-dependent dehydrogenase (Short-subunit alcohol dehydrogenase family) n=1 Tax=Marinoscillum furvescens DSM 4134 TaxID=1122208 RepID=A0A3D9L3S6_MARFU|nr:SDR family oxidoreductase [Marinoscillum furvescens]RED99460.1 NAD(P)-dependent dehydrogenase (short-subunit alcohol dehydrogenase family) [Marinoscillum furvescens DSM 4134]
MQKKVAVVTAASKGMGLAIVRKLHAEGYQLAIMARGAEVLGLGKELGAVALQGSVAEASDLRNLVDTAVRTYGKVDVVVNNTGHSAKGELLGLSDQDWHEGVDLLLMNVIRMSRMVTPIFEQNSGGSIINISTFGAKEPSLSFPISSVLRTSLTSFTKLYVKQFAAQQIRMNNVLPGFVDSYPVTEQVLSDIPAGRAATTQEVAELVAFLSSDKSSYINGQDILVDGGLTKGI